MKAAASSTANEEPLSYNLLGQRLGRKGRDTRERILAATERLLAEPSGAPITLSAVAREASLGMTTLYLYFSDLPELLLAAMEPIMASREASYAGQLRTRWPDESLSENCLRFVDAFYGFWLRHSRILHLRNAYADAGDERMVRHRIESSMPIIDLFLLQMDGDPAAGRSSVRFLATVMLTGLERMVTIATDVKFPTMYGSDPTPHVQGMLQAQARLLELAIRDGRATSRAQASGA